MNIVGFRLKYRLYEIWVTEHEFQFQSQSELSAVLITFFMALNTFCMVLIMFFALLELICQLFTTGQAFKQFS